MRKYPCFIVLLGSLLLGGCATTVQPLPDSAVAKIDYGAFPENYEQIIKSHFAKTLPESSLVQLRMEKPFPGYIQEGPLLGGKVEIAGYFVEVWLTAKTSASGAASERHLGVLILKEEVAMELTPTELAKVKRSS